MKLIYPFLLVFVLACTGERNKENPIVESKTDTTEIIRKFIYGLWSLDSGNAFTNVGYYFKQDGTVDFVAADVSGNWELISDDSLRISYSTIKGVQSYDFKLEYLNESKLILADKDGSYTFRKIPFGFNNDGMLLKGFGGKLSPGEEKKYSVNLPATKKISFKLISENPEITLRVFEGNNELTSAPLREWNAIIIRSGDYSVVVSRQPSSIPVTPKEFDLKVIAY